MNTLVEIKQGKPKTTSLLIAEKFGKRHKNVMQSIEKLECSDKFRRLNFQPSSYINEQNKSQPMYEITRDGFSFLVMGFTGKKAVQWKEDYITAFNRMEKQLLELAIQHQNQEWQQARTEGKQRRKELTDAIAELQEYAKSCGSKGYKHFFNNYTSMTYKQLFQIPTGKQPDGFRELLDTFSLRQLEMAERICTNIIFEEIEKGTPYKKIYPLCKEKVEQFSQITGAKDLHGIMGLQSKQLEGSP